MFATSEFVFLHVPRTGGTYVRERFKDRIVFYREHGRPDQLPNDLRDLPRFCFVRNPWDWYVSWWTFGQTFGNLPHWADSADFRNTIRLTAKREMDPCTKCFTKLSGGEILRFERLDAELEAFLRQHGIETPPPMPAVNSSHRGPYRAYYDDETRQLVGTQCEPLIRRFGYEF